MLANNTPQIEELLNRVSEAWLGINMSLFKHMLDYEWSWTHFGQNWGPDKSAGGVHLDDDASNN